VGNDNSDAVWQLLQVAALHVFVAMLATAVLCVCALDHAAIAAVFTLQLFLILRLVQVTHSSSSSSCCCCCCCYCCCHAPLRWQPHAGGQLPVGECTAARWPVHGGAGGFVLPEAVCARDCVLPQAQGGAQVRCCCLQETCCSGRRHASLFWTIITC
jgi:hypothetical protein